MYNVKVLPGVLETQLNNSIKVNPLYFTESNLGNDDDHIGHVKKWLSSALYFLFNGTGDNTLTTLLQDKETVDFKTTKHLASKLAIFLCDDHLYDYCKESFFTRDDELTLPAFYHNFLHHFYLSYKKDLSLLVLELNK